MKLFSIINFFILIFEFLDVIATYIFVPTILTNVPTIQFPLFFWVILSIKKDSSVLPQMEKVILHFMYHLMKHTFLYFNKLLPPTLFLLHRTHVLPPTHVFTYSSLFLVVLSLTLLHLCLLYLQVLSLSPTQQPTSHLIPQNIHPMCIRSKNGIFKPKTYLSTCAPTPPLSKPHSISEALSINEWRATMDLNFKLFALITLGLWFHLLQTVNLWVVNGSSRLRKVLMAW